MGFRDDGFLIGFLLLSASDGELLSSSVGNLADFSFLVWCHNLALTRPLVSPFLSSGGRMTHLPLAAPPSGQQQHQMQFSIC